MGMNALLDAITMARHGRTPFGTPLEVLVIRFILIDPEGLSFAGVKRRVNNLVDVPEALELSRMYAEMIRQPLPFAA